ncbi:MAG: hypothetical protein QOE77_1941 [Blastocatellia bacterium]|jgi:hypothetical protein|nr:hypothetical protein [Blastocatellia bacterium]
MSIDQKVTQIKLTPSNPTSSVIPEWVDQETLISAIEKSGYPLQGVVAEKLTAAGFNIEEEWGFIDRDTEEHRSLDIVASKLLTSSDGAVIPRLVLLIECKRSVHPYVFFKRVSDPETPKFPVVSAVEANIEEAKGGVGSRMYLPAPNQLILNLTSLPFVQEPPRCASFSQATLNGKKVLLSGEEPYNNIVIPLIKSLRYKLQLDRAFLQSDKPTPTLVLCLCILDTSMLLVEAPSKAAEPILTPWIRLLRLEAQRDQKNESHTFFGIDFLHADALEWFASEKLMPFAQEFARRAISLERVWKHGGIVTSLDDIQWDKIQPKK